MLLADQKVREHEIGEAGRVSIGRIVERVKKQPNPGVSIFLIKFGKAVVIANEKTALVPVDVHHARLVPALK